MERAGRQILGTSNRITIFGAGSRGDIQPCALLGSALQQAGYAPLLAVPENFRSFIQERGLPLHTLRGDVQQIMAGETGRDFMERGGLTHTHSAGNGSLMRLAPVPLFYAKDPDQAITCAAESSRTTYGCRSASTPRGANFQGLLFADHLCAMIRRTAFCSGRT